MDFYYIGIDGGGSKTCAILLDNQRNIMATVYGGPANIRLDVDMAYNSITNLVQELCQQFSLSFKQIKLGIGVAGYSVLEARQTLLSKLTGYQEVRLESDCHIACLAAHEDADGAIVICGTGVVGYSIKRSVGRQMGGWGFPHGDLGGGAWIGLSACQMLCKAIDGAILWSPLLLTIYSKFKQNSYEYKVWLLKATVKEFAETAKQVIKMREEDDLANKIYTTALHEIRLFIRALYRQNNRSPLQIAGGLAAVYLPDLHDEFPTITAMTTNPAIGGIYLFT